MRARIAFLGSPQFAVPCLKAAASQHEVVLVVTQPARPSGRGRRLEHTAVDCTAGELGLPVQTYRKENRAEIERLLHQARPDVLLVVAFGHILKRSTLATARCGAVNVHASLLPRWRGVAPIERALLAGDAVTGVTLMALDEGVDTGPMIAQRLVVIDPEETRVSLAEKLAHEGALLVQEKLGAFIAAEIAALPQNAEGATYAPRLEKDEGRIDWSAHPVEIWRRVRAFLGWPGAFTRLGDQVLKVHAVEPVDCLPRDEPGTVVLADARRGVHVACGGGTVALQEIQLPGKQRVPATALVQGRHLSVGVRLGPWTVEGAVE